MEMRLDFGAMATAALVSLAVCLSPTGSDAGIFKRKPKDPVKEIQEDYEKFIEKARDKLTGSFLENYWEDMNDAENRGQELSALKDYQDEVTKLKRKYRDLLEEYRRVVGEEPADLLVEEDFEMDPDAATDREYRQIKLASGEPDTGDAEPAPMPAPRDEGPAPARTAPRAPSTTTSTASPSSTSTAPGNGEPGDELLGAWQNIARPYDEIRILRNGPYYVLESASGLQKTPATFGSGILSISRGDAVITAFYDFSSRVLIVRKPEGQAKYERRGDATSFDMNFRVVKRCGIWDRPAVFRRKLIVEVPAGEVVTVLDIERVKPPANPIWARVSWVDGQGNEYPGNMLISMLDGAEERFVGEGFSWWP